MKTRVTKLTITPGELFHERGFEVEIVDESGGEFVEIRSNESGSPLRVDVDEWPFLRDAINRMFEEIAENESEAKLKKLLETPAPWEKPASDNGPPPWQETSSDSSWIPWNGGACPVPLDAAVHVRYRCGLEDDENDSAYIFRWLHNGNDYDIIAYKVVD